MTTKALIDIQTYPDGRVHAMWIPLQPELEYRGCPLGRGTTEEEAINDLIDRTNRESWTAINRHGVRVARRDFKEIADEL